jgi:predicted RNA-binding protein with RPS1 domain
MTDLVAAGEHCSMTERRADDATRDVTLWLKCEYLRHHIGDEFAGVVASVTRFGMFVELTDIYMEGLVHISALPSDYYHFDQASQRLVGEHTRKTYQLGDAVRVQVARVDLDDRKIDLEIVGEVTPGAGRRGNKKSIRNRSKTTEGAPSRRSKSGGKAAGKGERSRVSRLPRRIPRRQKKALNRQGRRKRPQNLRVRQASRARFVNDLAYGIHAVDVLLRRSPERIISLSVQSDRNDKRIQGLLALAQNQGVGVDRVSKADLDAAVAEAPSGCGGHY